MVLKVVSGQFLVGPLLLSTRLVVFQPQVVFWSLLAAAKWRSLNLSAAEIDRAENRQRPKSAELGITRR